MTEADLKKAVEDYLKILEKQGKLWYERLQAGNLLATYDGKGYRRIRLCRKGTADYIVIQSMTLKPKGCWVTFLELKAPKGKQSEAQREFQRTVEALGAEYILVRSSNELIEIFE